jgi:phosphoribosyl-ATP pyrophosphohydrolase/phosphoribosyl-AMP cyclohydrolase
MKLDQVESLDWSKGEGLLPAVVQDARTGKVLMLGYMNREALRATLGEKRVTFYSRSKQRLWTKGETSGNFLHLVDAAVDCDNDTLLVFGDKIGTTATRLAFLSQLESVIEQRVSARPEGSYTARLWAEGPTRMAQKVGEEGVEVALAAVTQTPEKLVGEAADLLFHLALLLKSRQLSLSDVVSELERRHAAKR